MEFCVELEPGTNSRLTVSDRGHKSKLATRSAQSTTGPAASVLRMFTLSSQDSMNPWHLTSPSPLDDSQSIVVKRLRSFPKLPSPGW